MLRPRVGWVGHRRMCLVSLETDLIIPFNWHWTISLSPTLLSPPLSHRGRIRSPPCPHPVVAEQVCGRQPGDCKGAMWSCMHSAQKILSVRFCALAFIAWTKKPNECVLGLISMLALSEHLSGTSHHFFFMKLMMIWCRIPCSQTETKFKYSEYFISNSEWKRQKMESKNIVLSVWHSTPRKLYLGTYYLFE